MAEVWRPTLADFIEAAAVILETEPDQIERLPGLGLAESALEAPFAQWPFSAAIPSPDTAWNRWLRAACDVAGEPYHAVGPQGTRLRLAP